jgi:hypothetical protein
MISAPQLFDVGAAAPLLDRQIDDLLLDVRGLSLVLEILAARQASDAELAAHRRELDRRRARLAELIRESGRTTAGLDHAA